MDSKPEYRASLPIWLTTMIAAIWFGRDFLIPLAITGLLFILSSALVDRFKQIKILGRSLPGWLAHVLSATTVIGAILAFGLIVSSSAEEVEEALPKYQERLTALADQIEGFLGPRLVESAKGAFAEADMGGWVAALASEFAGAFSMFALVALYLAFLVTERVAWTEKLPRLASSETETQRVRKIIKRTADGVKQYMWVNAVTSAMSGVVAFLIFSWIDLDFAALLALIVFAAGFIPNIGAFIAITLPSLVALIQFDDLTPFLIVLFGYGLADQFISNVIQPSMQGRSLNLSTFMVMVSLTFWATLWGGIGAFLAVPMMVVTMVICAELPGARWIAVLLSSDGLLDDPEDRSSTSPQRQPRETDHSHPAVNSRKPTPDEEIVQLRTDFEDLDK